MVQHYSEEFKAFIQYIQNDSKDTNLVCYAKTNVSYLNMLQMGDSPLIVQKPAEKVSSSKMKSDPNRIYDPKNFKKPSAEDEYKAEEESDSATPRNFAEELAAK